VIIILNKDQFRLGVIESGFWIVPATIHSSQNPWHLPEALSSFSWWWTPLKKKLHLNSS